MQNALRTALAALAVVTLATPAGADMKVYYHVGSWDAFSGPGADGKMVCGVGSTNPSDSRAFSLRFEIGSDSVQFQAKKPSWTIPPGTLIPVVVQIGLNTPWNFQGSGDGQVIQWPLDRSDMQTFDAQFRQASSMTVSFPSGNEAPWTVGLSGSTAASNAFGRCVADVTQRTSGQPPAAVPAGPTQPYGQAPTQPMTLPAAPGPTHP
jgi:hypothetical protein